MSAQTASQPEPEAARACCRVSGLPVYSSPAWHWTSPQGRYAIRIWRIGERIFSLEHRGYVDLPTIRRSFALFQRALAGTPAANGPFTVLDDHSQISGASLNARRYIVKHLLQQPQLTAYIAYGASTVFNLSLKLAGRINLFDSKLRLVADYAQAMALAQKWGPPVVRPRQAHSPASPAHDESSQTALADNRADSSLREFARELLDHIGHLNLEHDGGNLRLPAIAADHPFRAVYDALELIHVDMQRILERHQRNLKHLQSQEQALLEKNAALAETHTTLKILLRTRREEHRKMTARIGQRFRDLLLPIVEALEDTHPRGAQLHQAVFIRDIITHISQPFIFDTPRDALNLTAREILTAYLVARGCTSREAARVLNTSPRTIDRYRSGLRRKAGLQGTGQPLGGWIRRRTHTEALPGL